MSIHGLSMEPVELSVCTCFSQCDTGTLDTNIVVEVPCKSGYVVVVLISTGGVGVVGGTRGGVYALVSVLCIVVFAFFCNKMSCVVPL